MTSRLPCYNKGCGKEFIPEENGPESCQYHPGAPVFHDALKGWSCCKKRCTDFTDFLNIPGCTKGVHSNEKPPEPEKPEKQADIPSLDVNKEKKSEVIVKAHLPKTQEEINSRPSPDEPRTRLIPKISPSLKAALEKLEAEGNGKAEADPDSDSSINIGTTCKNGGCQQTYQGPQSNQEKCTNHTGIPIFHEGMKYWSCCKRKTSNFNDFLQQAGCSTDTHLWVKEDVQKVACRYDWHQTGGFVIISIYSKMCDPTQSFVEVNKVSIHAKIVFDKGISEFEQTFVLEGEIVPTQSSVTMAQTKVEIKLKKAEAFAWKDLEFRV